MQYGNVREKVKRLLTTSLISGAVLFFGASFLTSSTAQRRMKPFSHATRAHKEGKYNNCASCHTLPTKNWMAARRDKLEPFPDVVNYPYHNSCFACHTKDIYSNGAAFCGSCHVTASMRAQGGKGVLPFPLKSHSMQFKTIFPHDIHQDLIASNQNTPDYAPAHFVPVSFVSTDDKPKPTFYNCAICHKTVEKLPKYENRKLTAEKPLATPMPDVFAMPVTADFFKNSPTGHESCFTCHYQYQNLPAGKQSCAGCHAPTTPYFEKSVTKRYSLKFNHERDGHYQKDCASCHLRITQNKDVNTMLDADVPITSCKQCHATQETSAPWKQIITTEVEKREETVSKAEPVFQCSYCHTSAIGSYEIPASHRKP